MIYTLGRKFRPIIIIGLFCSLGILSIFEYNISSDIPTLIISNKGDDRANPHIPAFPVEMKLRDDFDLDEDKIDDVLEDQVLNVKGQSGTEIELIVELQEPVTQKILNSFQDLGGKIMAGPWNSSLYGFAGTLPVGQIQSFAQLHNTDLLLIQPNNVAEASMAFAAQQVGVRPSVWDDLNMTGDWNSSIAILDSGIDPTHVDFNPGYFEPDPEPNFDYKIVGWKDFTEGGNNNTPSDEFGHGTHVAGIAAGNGFTTRDDLGRVVATKTGEQVYAIYVPGFGYVPYSPGAFESTLFPLSIYQAGLVEINFNWTDISMMSTASVANITLWRDTAPILTLNTTQSNTVYTLEWEVYPSELGVYYLNMTTVIGDGGLGTAPAIALRAEAHFPMQDLPDDDPLLTGIANNTRIVAVKVLNSSGQGLESHLLNAIDWVIANRVNYHITVVSLSLTMSSSDAVINAVENAVNSGLVVVVAAGNNGAGTNYVGDTSPANTDSVITVGSVNSLGNISSFSSQGGETPSQLTTKPDIVAPGGSFVMGDIFSADTNSGDTSYMGDSYPDDAGMMSGTSMATPVVSGAVALLIQAFGGSNSWNYSRDDVLLVKALLCMTATEVYPLTRESSTAQYSPTLDRGFKDAHEGFGIINTYAALTAILHNITVGEEVTGTLYTAGNSSFQNNKHAWARHVDLTANATHSYVFNLTAPTTGDFDLYLFSDTTTAAGEPIILRRSIKAGNGGNEIIYYNCTHDERVYIVVKAVAGSGQFSLKLDGLMVNDSTGPIISRWGHNPVVPSPTMPVTIVAMVDDAETGLGNISVYYTNNVAGGLWNVMEMVYQSDGTYAATIGKFPVGPVAYYINASNGILNWSVSPDGAPNLYYDLIVRNSSFAILFVDDEYTESPYFIANYTNALNAIGVQYAIWSTLTEGTPSVTLMQNYDAVIWGMGIFSSLNKTECDSLQDYLDSGGNLFIMGQLIALFGNSISPSFVSNYLKISSSFWTMNLINTVTMLNYTSEDPISGNLSLTLKSYLNGGDNIYLETIQNLTGAVPIYNISLPGVEGTYNVSAIRYSGAYKLVLCDFAFESINDANDQASLLNRSLQFFGYNPEFILDDPPYITEILYFNDLDPVNQTILLNGSAWDAVSVNHTRFYIDNFWCADVSTLNYSYIWDTTSWPDGLHTVTFVAFDNNWYANSTKIIFSVDNSPPENLKIDPLTNGSHISGLYGVIPTFDEPSGIDRVEYSVNNSLNFTATSFTYNWTWDTSLPVFGDGWWELNVTVFSVLNHSTTVNVTVLIDNHIPNVNITSPLNFTDDNTPLEGIIPVAVDASDDLDVERIELWVNGTYVDTDLEAPYGFSWDSSAFRDGWNLVEVRGFDSAQNMNTSNVLLLIDNRAPENLSIAPLTNGTWINETHRVSVSYQDLSGVDRVEFSVNGSLNATVDAAPYQWDWDTTDIVFGGGWWELNVTAFSVLNHSTTINVTVLIDNAIPNVIITYPTNFTVWENPFSLDYVMSDDSGLDRAELWINGIYNDTRVGGPYSFSFDTTWFPEGLNLMEVRAYDLAQQMNSSTLFVTFDNFAPANLVLESLTNGSWINGTFMVNATVEDLSGIDRVEFSVNGSLDATVDNPGPYQWAWDTTIVGDGWWELNVTAFSPLNHSTTVLATVIIDSQIPFINLTLPYNETIISGIVTFEVNATDASGIDHVDIYLGGTLSGTDSEGPYSLEWNSATVSDGWVSVDVHAFDHFGKENFTHCEFLVDNAPPLVFITSPANGSIFTGQQLIEVTATETPGISITSVEFYLNGYLNSSTSSAPYEWSWDTTQQGTGEWNLTVRAYSSTGRVNETMYLFILDHNATWIDITLPLALTYVYDVSGHVTVEFTAVDNYGVNTSAIYLYVDGVLFGTNNTPTQFYWASISFVEGIHELNVTVFDLAGNQNSSKIEVLLDNLGPMVSWYTPYAGIYFEGTCAFAANASDPTGVQYVEFFIDGTSCGINTTNLFEFNNDTTLLADGIHTFMFVAHSMTNKLNSTSTSIRINNLPPVITNLVLPDTIIAGTDVVATTQVSDPFLASVVLFYSVDGGATWAQAPMVLGSGSSYSGTIPGTALEAGKTLSYYVIAVDATAKIGYYLTYNASNPLQKTIESSNLLYLIIIIIAGAAIAVTGIVVVKTRKGRSKGVSKKEVKSAEKAVAPPVQKISKKTPKGQPPWTGEAPLPPSKSIFPPVTGGQAQSPADKKLSVKFAFQGGQPVKSAPELHHAEEKAEVFSPPTQQVVPPPAPTAPEPAPIPVPTRILYCATCNQYYEVAENNLKAGLACSTCANPLFVTLTCPSCNEMLSLELDVFLKGKNMQAPCPYCGNPILVK